MNDNRVTEPEFDKRFGQRVAQSIGFNADSKCVVTTALTRTKYVAYNWATGDYDVEPRRRS
jgi:hypothetical protein